MKKCTVVLQGDYMFGVERRMNWPSVVDSDTLRCARGHLTSGGTATATGRPDTCRSPKMDRDMGPGVKPRREPPDEGRTIELLYGAAQMATSRWGTPRNVRTPHYTLKSKDGP